MVYLAYPMSGYKYFKKSTIVLEKNTI